MEDVLADVFILRPEAPEFQPSITPPDMDPPIAEPPTPPPDVPGTAVSLEDDHMLQEPEPHADENELATDGDPAADPGLSNTETKVTCSSRESRPPRRFQDAQFCHKATLLLSLANVANQNIVENVFHSWLCT